MTAWNDNFTNQTLNVISSCTGSWPHKSVRITSYLIIMFLSLIGSSFIVAVFYRNKTLRTPVHYFIVNMAISDLIIPMIVLPSLIGEAYHDGLWLVEGVLGSILCKIVPIAWQSSINVSICSMVAIGVDRFHAVLFHMKPPLISKKTCRRTLLVTWVFSVAIRAHFLYAYQLACYETGLYCTFQGVSLSETIEMLKITLITWLCLFFLSSIVLTVLYSSIIIFLYRQTNNLKLSSEIVQKRAKRNRRITCMLVIVVVAFYAVSTLISVLTIMGFLNPSMYSRLPCFLVWFAYTALPVSYPLFNPLVYLVSNEEYSKGFKELLCCPWPCMNKCNHCFHATVANSAGNAEEVNDAVENFELQEQ